jgi:hypothetical protein
MALPKGGKSGFDLKIQREMLRIKGRRTNATALKKFTSKAARHSFRSLSAIRLTGLKVPWFIMRASMREKVLRA